MYHTHTRSVHYVEQQRIWCIYNIPKREMSEETGNGLGNGKWVVK